VIWLVLLLLLVLIFGLGSILNAAFWVLVLLAVIGVVLFFFGSRRLRGRSYLVSCAAGSAPSAATAT
jgi:hypothetical protein